MIKIIAAAYFIFYCSSKLLLVLLPYQLRSPRLKFWEMNTKTKLVELITVDSATLSIKVSIPINLHMLLLV